jgi:phage FluMu protein Com
MLQPKRCEKCGMDDTHYQKIADARGNIHIQMKCNRCRHVQYIPRTENLLILLENEPVFESEKQKKRRRLEQHKREQISFL